MSGNPVSENPRHPAAKSGRGGPRREDRLNLALPAHDPDSIKIAAGQEARRQL